MNYKCLSISNQIEYDLPVNLIYSSAVLVADINEDKKNELVIGTGNGDLLIHNGMSNTNPWLKGPKQNGCQITCLCYDDVTNVKRKFLIAFDAIGYIYLYSTSQARRRYQSDIGPSKPLPQETKFELRTVYQKKLAPNPKHMLVSDLYTSGVNDLIVLYTDRKVNVYRWYPSVNPNINQSSNSSMATINFSVIDNGNFLLQQSWEFEEQIHSISIAHDFQTNTMSKCLLATHCGARVLQLKLKSYVSNIGSSNSSSTSSLLDLTNASSVIVTKKPAIIKTPTPKNIIEEIIDLSSYLKNSDSTNSTFTPSYILTNIRSQDTGQFGYLVTFNGDIFFLNLSNSNKKCVIWHKSINNSILNIFKYDIDNDYNDELIISSPDGQIHILNIFGEILCFDLGEPIHMFNIGLLNTSFSVYDSVQSFDIGSIHGSTALEAMMDSPPHQSSNDNLTSTLDERLSFIFISSVTSKLCFVHAENLLKSTPRESRFKCENVFTKFKLFNNGELNRILSNLNEDKQKSLFKALLYNHNSSIDNDTEDEHQTR